MLLGSPAHGLTAEQGSEVGAFLAELHRVCIQSAVARGAPSYEQARAEHHRVVGELRTAVFPRLDPVLHKTARALLDRLAADVVDPALLRADLGPDHLLVQHGEITGVIDWSDARIGDPALDLAWMLHGSSAGEAYNGPPDIIRRARDWHVLGPWYEVLYGIENRRPDLIASGMSGVVVRLTEG